MGLDYETLDRYNHFHFHVSKRTNRILCILMTLALIAYSAIGVLMFTTIPATNPIPFVIANSIWLVVAALVLFKFTHRPYLVIGLYMMVIGTDRILSCLEGVFESNETFFIIVEIIMSLWMFGAGVCVVFGRLMSRYPSIIFTSIMFCLDVGDVLYLINYEGDFDPFLVFSGASYCLRLLFYLFLIMILLCNDNPERKGNLKGGEVDD